MTTNITDLDAIIAGLIPRLAATQQLLAVLLSGVENRDEIFEKAAQALAQPRGIAPDEPFAVAAQAELDTIWGLVKTAAAAQLD